MVFLNIELQARVVEAHEKLARAFFDHTTAGWDYLRERTEQRSVQITYCYNLLATVNCYMWASREKLHGYRSYQRVTSPRTR